jgi:hypothetical protein
VAAPLLCAAALPATSISSAFLPALLLPQEALGYLAEGGPLALRCSIASVVAVADEDLGPGEHCTQALSAALKPVLQVIHLGCSSCPAQAGGRAHRRAAHRLTGSVGCPAGAAALLCGPVDWGVHLPLPPPWLAALLVSSCC